ncbi:galactokinase [Sediminibacterium sp.]|uniref:galactokinase n=1 Tax=Sediminibacterium sp. TaxID=1917865 RepID=UPI003F69C03D
MKNELTRLFIDQFQVSPDVIVRSPGRVNIIGEHADYNNGFVLPAAIDKAAYIALSLREDDEIHLTAVDLKENFSTTIHHLKPIGDVSWPNYILGGAAQFIKKKISLKGFNLLLTSNVPIGAGLSSSAAVECATVFALNHLLKTGFSRIEMVNMAQKAEHEYAGVMCGIMDQFASMMGKASQVIKLDCRSLDYQYVPFKLDGIKILLLNTNVKHSLASSEYNTRREECEKAIKLIKPHHPSVESLRDVTMEMLDQYVLPADELVYRRSRFVIDEMERLNDACNYLEQNDIASLGECMFETHEGLSKQYEVSCKELDFLVDYVKDNPEVLGARMMGGGFGGCTINLVQEDAIARLVSEIKPAYEAAMNLPLDFYIASIENGTEIM